MVHPIFRRGEGEPLSIRPGPRPPRTNLFNSIKLIKVLIRKVCQLIKRLLLADSKGRMLDASFWAKWIYWGRTAECPSDKLTFRNKVRTFVWWNRIVVFQRYLDKTSVEFRLTLIHTNTNSHLHSLMLTHIYSHIQIPLHIPVGTNSNWDFCKH